MDNYNWTATTYTHNLIAATNQSALSSSRSIHSTAAQPPDPASTPYSLTTAASE